MPRTESHVLTWDWREQPDLDQLAEVLQALSRGTIHLHQVETGSDQYAIVLSNAKLDGRQANEAYARWCGL